MLACFSRGVLPSGGRGWAAGRGPVWGQCSQQEITAREQKVTTQERDPQAAHSLTSERKQLSHALMLQLEAIHT